MKTIKLVAAPVAVLVLWVVISASVIAQFSELSATIHPAEPQVEEVAIASR